MNFSQVRVVLKAEHFETWWSSTLCPALEPIGVLAPHKSTVSNGESFNLLRAVYNVRNGDQFIHKVIM